MRGPWIGIALAGAGMLGCVSPATSYVDLGELPSPLIGNLRRVRVRTSGLARSFALTRQATRLGSNEAHW